MSVIATRLERPHGLTGRLVGRFMSRSNGALNRWVVQQIGLLGLQNVGRVIEIGSGPGVCLHELLRAFPDAHVWGVDPSPEMVAQARRRNAAEVRSGRLILLPGDMTSLAELPPADLILACHVLYFWHEPVRDLSLIHEALRPGGRFALAYQLRSNMPPVSQREFPKQGHLLYDDDDQVSTLLEKAGFRDLTFLVKGSRQKPEGRMALSKAPSQPGGPAPGHDGHHHQVACVRQANVTADPIVDRSQH